MATGGVLPLPVTHQHALAVGDLPSHHRDPFDRVLICQAQIEDLVVLTSDRAFHLYDVDLVDPASSGE